MLEIARQGAALGCKEALFTLGTGPRPGGSRLASGLTRTATTTPSPTSGRWPSASLRRPACCRTQPGRHDLAVSPAPQAGRPVHGHDARDDSGALYHREGCSALGSPDKDPKVRLRVLEDAGRSNVPFTTGILIGIGETPAMSSRDPRCVRCPASTTASRKSSFRTSALSRTPRCAPPPTRSWPTSPPRSRSPASSSAPRRASRRRRTSSVTSTSSSLTRASTTGAASHRLPRTT